MAVKEDGRAWQVDVWNSMSDVYAREVDPRFAPIVARSVERAEVRPGDHVLDLGTGTGGVAFEAAPRVGSTGKVTAIDISDDMIRIARSRAEGVAEERIVFRQGGAEDIPAADGSIDVLIGTLSFMYVVDRAVAAKECARVLKPSGRFVAAAWAGPESADIVRFQSTAGSFAPPPPVGGVGPGALADAKPFVGELADAGIQATVQSEIFEFGFPNFESAWEVLAGVTAKNLTADDIDRAKRAIQEVMWPDPSGPLTFRNETQFIVGRRD